MTPEPNVILLYAETDRQMVTQVADRLTEAGIKICFDLGNLSKEHWANALRSAVAQSSYCMVFTSSRSASKRGFLDINMCRALEKFESVSNERVYLVPMRLDECEPPCISQLNVSWIDIFPDTSAVLDCVVRMMIGGAQNRTSCGVRLGGIYQSGRTSGKPRHWSYLRFYPDGTVKALSSTGIACECVRLFENDDNKNIASGSYASQGSTIYFTVESKRAAIEYEGEIADDSIILRSYSRTTSHRAVVQHRYVAL